MRKHRLLTACLALLCVFLLLFSSFFVSFHTAHACAGENCPICAQLDTCEKALKSVAAAVSALTLALLCGGMAALPPLPLFREMQRPSPIALKVKLSN